MILWLTITTALSLPILIDGKLDLNGYSAFLLKSLHLDFNAMCLILFFRIGFGRLEDPDSGEVKQFVQEQVRLTESVLKSCDAREKLRDKITKLFDHPRYDVPFKRGDKYFYFHNTGLQAQNVLYVQVNL